MDHVEVGSDHGYPDVIILQLLSQLQKEMRFHFKISECLLVNKLKIIKIELFIPLYEFLNAVKRCTGYIVPSNA